MPQTQDGPLPPGTDVPVRLATRMVQGVGLAIGITLFRVLVGPLVGLPPSLPSLVAVGGWAVLIAAAGGLGGAVYYMTEGWRRQGGWRKTAANVASLLAYCLLLFAALLVVLSQAG